MKKIILKLIVLTLALMGFLGLPGCKEADFQTNGIMLLTVVDDFNYDPVANANVVVYRNVDDLQFEQGAISQGQTDLNGNIVIDDLSQGAYYIDIAKGNLNNWNIQFQFTQRVEDGRITMGHATIGINTFGIISSAEGKSWSVEQIMTETGEDVTNDPSYSCLADDIYFFQKAGYFSIDKGTTSCDPTIPSFVEGSWSEWEWVGFSMGDGFTESLLVINEHSETHFVATGDTDLGNLTLRFEIIN